MKSCASFATFFSSFRIRLTLWYLGAMAILLFAHIGILYNTQYRLNTDANDYEVETQLYQDLQPISRAYTQALLTHQSPDSQQFALSKDEVVLLLLPEGTILDKRGPLPAGFTPQLQARAARSLAPFNLASSSTQQNRGPGWWSDDTGYHFVAVPILSSNIHVADLLLGLPRQREWFLPLLLFVHGMVILFISLVGGYWLASKALRPVRMITRIAKEINATDLRRRINLKRRDEFGELAATFDQMLARLEAAFKRQTQFTADASHELRTPLTIIELEVNRALNSIGTAEEQQQALKHIEDENEQMMAIVNNLMLLARADTGRIELHLQEVDLSDLALCAVERLLPLAQQYHVLLSTGDLPELLVDGDPHYLSRALANLIENAIKYTSSVGKRVHVELVREQGRYGVIRVQDDGPGIAEEHLPYLFERFYRADKARRYSQKAGTEKAGPGGTGLGLSIVQWIVQAHRGEVRLESKIGVGSVFEVYLPLK